MKLLNNRKTKGADIYGNYQLRMQVSITGILLLLIIVFRIDWQPTSEFQIKERAQEIVVMDEIIQTEQIERPVAPPRPSAPVSVPNEVVLEDDIFDLDTDLYIFDAPIGMPPPPPPMADNQYDLDEIFVIVEEMPVLIGGISSIYENLNYPYMARHAGIQGRVVLQFIIDEAGSVQSPIVLRGIGGGCDEAAIEALKKVRFTPGRQRGRPVKVQYTVTIHFNLTS